MAPLHFWPVLFVTFPLLVWMIDGVGAARWRGGPAGFLIGWWFGFGYFVAGLYWVGYAFLVDAKTFGWLLPFAVTALPAGLAVFTGLGVALARSLWTPGALRILTLAASLTTSEWLRGHVLSGFPWNAFGYALTAPLALAQSAAVFGLWGLTFIAVAVFASAALLADDRKRGRFLPLISAVGLLAGLATFGAIRLALDRTAMVDGVRLRIMQPNVAQDEKFSYRSKDEVLRHYIELSSGTSSSAPLDGITQLIWPESAFPFFLVREPAALAMLARMLPPETQLITGAARLADPTPGVRGVRAYNSIYVIDHNGSILSIYDKLHLVPFGEYLPFQSILESIGLMQLTKMPGGFVPGEKRQRIALPGAPSMLPLICYEVIFPDEAVPPGERPGWLLNLTNDAWFGISPGPYQHLQQARVLAIEEGLPLVRAANTGVSAIIDPFGRIVASLPLGSAGTLDSGLPRPIAATIHARLGDLWLWLLVAVIFIASLGIRCFK
ncbi:MAG: apolipoprotein N-acyltransferase [Xanthobacteraceae bacterium]|nr:apolipoprotein N-acyltransferase [Xanthobacteraceae bacterium]